MDTRRASSPSSSRPSGPGFHQLAYWTDGFRGHHERGARRPAGRSCGPGASDLGVRFAYVEPPNAPADVIEISELTEVTAANAMFVRDAAADWDGSDPIRMLGASHAARSAPVCGCRRTTPARCYLSRFITLSAAAQCSSETHSRAKAATASVVVTPRITRLISPAGRCANALAILRHSVVEGRARDQRGRPGRCRSASAAVRITARARQQQRPAVADQRRRAARHRPTPA